MRHNYISAQLSMSQADNPCWTLLAEEWADDPAFLPHAACHVCDIWFEVFLVLWSSVAQTFIAVSYNPSYRSFIVSQLHRTNVLSATHFCKGTCACHCSQHSVPHHLFYFHVVAIKRMRKPILSRVCMFQESHRSGLWRELLKPRRPIFFSVLKDILHLTELQAAYFEQKAFISDTCVRIFCFSANPHQQQRDASGQKPWKGDIDRASFVSQCSFYLICLPSTTREVGKDLPAMSGILQHQATFILF